MVYHWSPQLIVARYFFLSCRATDFFSTAFAPFFFLAQILLQLKARTNGGVRRCPP